MKRFVAGADRTQSTLLPELLDDFIDESNSVRVIDAFVDALSFEICRDWRKVKTTAWREANRERWRLFLSDQCTGAGTASRR
jgi:hypothetical protein